MFPSSFATAFSSPPIRATHAPDSRSSLDYGKYCADEPTLQEANRHKGYRTLKLSITDEVANCEKGCFLPTEIGVHNMRGGGDFAVVASSEDRQALVVHERSQFRGREALPVGDEHGRELSPAHPENATTRIWFCCRSSVVVSEPFDFIAEPQALVELFAAFAFADRRSLGFYPTMQIISSSGAERSEDEDSRF
ncbi:hypothetical protein BS47DRAFT_1369178 [Hydnum rufescens UP504]|uniref:Fungal-type protein kinase domain-containing protein n=1 Tax=Hydnum rufescens UP504 TaxID=1448309 RepID=A0A9P6ADI3_9AGAM|nr:hypothetical protein BS47DRAFT_1369178 [Hydnum rufescens UP504]